MKVTVTHKSNVRFNDDQTFILEDGEKVGFIRNTHVVPTHILDEKGVPHFGLVQRAEVYWQHQRTPAFTLEDPNDLAWLFMEEDSVEVQTAEEFEEDSEDFEDADDDNDFEDEDHEESGYF